MPRPTRRSTPRPTGQRLSRVEADTGRPAQEVADAVKRLIDMPAGQRPLRMVVGPTSPMPLPSTTGVRAPARDLNEVLAGPDQAAVWSRTRPSAPTFVVKTLGRGTDLKG